MKLSEFVQECVRRLCEWNGQNVLITLNTRRSARAVMEALRGAGVTVEFITADVNPHDRLAAIESIKTAASCVVVSTQCIEAGVDIDMHRVIRDFGPLDSLIQVAGRCNRNGGFSRGEVEVVCLEEDDRETTFASYIYDEVLRTVTVEVLGTSAEIPEEEVYPLTLDYFHRLVASKDTGEETLRKWASWETVDSIGDLFQGKQPRKVAFVVIEQDPSLRGELLAACEVPDRWERRRALRKLAARVAQRTVTVYCREGLDPERYADAFPPGQPKTKEGPGVEATPPF
jgi:CRISPR-associated endonuclease/helicase Cas3